MRELTTIANNTAGNITETHTLALPSCCPVSKNPRPGSSISITYKPDGCSLEIASLFALIHRFRGGLHSETGELLVRDMEGMIDHIAKACAQVLGVGVVVKAYLLLLPKQEMELEVHAEFYQLAGETKQA